MTIDTTKPAAAAPVRRAPRFSGLSGNEMYCLAAIGFEPGNLLVGNSVFSLGFLGSLSSGLRTLAGGEVTQITEMIVQGRELSLRRFSEELAQSGGTGATGVTSELIFHPGNIEFLTVGSSIHVATDAQVAPFTSSSDGQELFSQWDAGYQPLSFVFGNVAYSIGIGSGISGAFKQLAKGEVREYTEVFNTTRHRALQRIKAEASRVGANSVVGIRTTILPVGTSGVHEMIMIGTASHNPQIASVAESVVAGVTTSDMTAEETWSVTKMGFAPQELVIGTSVYSLGFMGGVKAMFKNFVKGEINELTQLIYDAREESLKKVQLQAEAVGADDVLGIKTYIYNLGGGLIEFLAIGTAVKRVDGLSTYSEQLPPQAVIRDKDTFVDTANLSYGRDLGMPNA